MPSVLPALRQVVLVPIVLSLTAAVAAWAQSPGRVEKPTAAKPTVTPSAKPRVAVTISKETTRVTEPLREDGYVDYVAAIDRRFREGVTPETNAAVLFWQAMGPREINPRHRDEYFRRLGMPPLPEEGDYYVPLSEYAKRAEDAANPNDAAPDAERLAKVHKQLDAAMRRPWSQSDFPLAARWLAANDKPLATIVEASKRPRRYDPFLAGQGETVIAVLLPALQQQREATRALNARAMLRLSEGKVDKAWEDLLACHRLARLAGQGPTLVDALVAVAIDSIACAGDQALVQHARLTAAEAARIRDDLGKLSPLLRMVDKIDIAERYVFLDCVSAVARDGLATMGEAIDGQRSSGTADWLLNLAARVTVDWDRVLRMGNSWYDRVADAFRKPTRPQRQQALQRIDADIRNLAQTAKDMKSLAFSSLVNPREAHSQRLGEIFVALLLPAISACADAEDRAAMQFDLVRLAFALAAYRADHGAYPAKLASLAPQYVPEVPRDIFSQRELHYTQQAQGYLLYSVGANGKDDGAKGYEDRNAGEDWDDLVVRVPAAAKQAREEE